MSVRRRNGPSDRDLAAFADGSLPAAKRHQVEQAVSASRELRAAVGAQQHVLGAIDSAARERAPSSLRARVRLINSRLVIMPGLAGAAVIVRPSPNDPTTATELGFDPDKSRALAGISSASLPSVPVLINPAREMAVTIGAFGPRTIVLPVSPATLTDAASKLQIA